MLPLLNTHKSFLSSDKSSILNRSILQPNATPFSQNASSKVNDVAPQEERVFVPDSLYRRIVVEVLSHDSAVLDSFERFVVAASIHIGVQVPPIVSDPFSQKFLNKLPSSLLLANKRSKGKTMLMHKRQPKMTDQNVNGKTLKGSKPEPDLGALLKTFARPGVQTSEVLRQTQPDSDIQTLTDQTFVDTQSHCSPYFGALLDVQRPPYSIWLRTLLKSVHVHKSHRVQYEIRSHACVFTFKELTGPTADTLLEYIERNLPEGCAIKVTRERIEPIPDEMANLIRVGTLSARLNNKPVSESPSVSAGKS